MLLLLPSCFSLGESGHSELGAEWIIMTTHTHTHSESHTHTRIDTHCERASTQLETRLTFYPTHNTRTQCKLRQWGQ